MMACQFEAPVAIITIEKSPKRFDFHPEAGKKRNAARDTHARGGAQNKHMF
ncbi:hypothetical protein SAMN04488527_107126 [Aliiroseovarius crassostreae]|nr:hypothetical protein SAMN04488527_107126 [Aliiroseovarius crassostreae]